MMKEVEDGNFGKLDEMHHLSAGFKACFTKIAYEGIDTCRQACGGAGFNSFSGLPLIQADFAPNTTLEGDNTVMLQQVAKLIFKQWRKLSKGEYRPSGIFTYFNHIDNLLSNEVSYTTIDDFLDLEKLDRALAARSAYRIKYTMDLCGKSQEPEVEKINAIYAQDIVRMAHSHIMYVTFKIFRDTLGSYKCPNVRLHMENIARLYALH